MYNPLNRHVSNNLKKYLPNRDEKISTSNPYKKAYKVKEQDPEQFDDPDAYDQEDAE